MLTPDRSIGQRFDTYNEVDGMAERGDFIVSPEAAVVAYEVISSNVGRNAEELLRRVQAFSSSTNMAIRSALPTGLRARTPSDLASILLANCECYLTDGLSIRTGCPENLATLEQTD